MRALPAWLVYGIAGFGAGFIFGAIREIFLIPKFGDVRGHWYEFIPLIIAIGAIGFFVTRHWKIKGPAKALATGFFVVGVLLTLESSFSLLVMGMPFDEYLASFNIFEGKLFPFGLFIMLLMPWLSQMFINLD